MTEVINGSLLETIWAVSPQAKARALASNRLSDTKKQFACIYNLVYLLTEKEYSLTSSMDNLPSFIYKNLLSDKSLLEVLRARYLNLLMDDMDFSRYLMDISADHYEEVRTTVNMETYCFKVRTAMVNNVEKYEKLCTVFQVPFRPEGASGARRSSRYRASFIHTSSDQSMNTKTEKDYEDMVKTGIHNHQQYEDQIVSAILARYQDLQTKMARLRSTQINLILDRPELRTALECIEKSRYANILRRLTSGKESNFPGKAFKQPNKVIEGIKPEDSFSEERIKFYHIFRTILSQ
jgi:hypothetical protein